MLLGVTACGALQEPGSLTLEPCRRFVDDWVTVSEPEIAAAMLGVRDQHDGMLLEGALSAGSQGKSRTHQMPLGLLLLLCC